MKKDTSEMLKELEQCEEFHAFHQTNESQLVDRSIADYVNELIAAKGLKKADCVVIFGICKKLSVLDINALLYEYGLNVLG